ncbi:MAG: hypothetical protein ACRDD1_21770, partial [Planctomycetia bacterium]
GGTLDVAPASGTVTYKGAPLTKGLVSLTPTAPKGLSAAGEIKSDGSFSLKTTGRDSGAMPGTYNVRIESWDEPPTMGVGKANEGKSAVPKKYLNPATSGLTAEIKAGQSNVLKFDLAD